MAIAISDYGTLSAQERNREQQRINNQISLSSDDPNKLKNLQYRLRQLQAAPTSPTTQPTGSIPSPAQLPAQPEGASVSTQQAAPTNQGSMSPDDPRYQTNLDYMAHMYSKGSFDEQKYRDQYQQLTGQAPTEMPDQYAKVGGSFISAPSYDPYEGFTGTYSGSGGNALSMAQSQFGGGGASSSGMDSAVYEGDLSEADRAHYQQQYDTATAAAQREKTAASNYTGNPNAYSGPNYSDLSGGQAPTGVQSGMGANYTAPTNTYVPQGTQNQAPQASQLPMAPTGQPVGGPQASQLPATGMPAISQLPATGGQNPALGAYNPDFAQTQYDRQMSLREPYMKQEKEGMEVQLRNQGLRPGTEAYDRAEKKLREQHGEEMSRMSQDAMRLGADEQQREFGRWLGAGQFGEAQRAQRFGEQGQQFGQQMSLAQLEDARRRQDFNENMGYGNQSFNQEMMLANYQNQLRNQWLQEQYMDQGFNFNMMQGMLSGGQVGMPQMPGYTGSGQAQAPNYLGAAAGNDAYDPWNNFTGSLGNQAGKSAADWIFNKGWTGSVNPDD